MDDSMEICRICDGKIDQIITAKEMMLGTEEKFEYGHCEKCGAVQLLNPPENVEVYYPSYYYSFIQVVAKLKPLPFFKRLIGRYRMLKKYRKASDGILGYLKPLRVLPDAKILDIGCGKGQLICDMFNIGFRNVKGVDKFILQEYDYGHGIKVVKRDLSELDENDYDLLMMHHVFEHMDDPINELSKCNSLLKPDGSLIIRIPVIAEAWRKYGSDWVQLDAPRHFFLHTVESIEMMAKRTGFEVVKVSYDSTGFQFWGSELYKKGIPLVDPLTKKYINGSDFFSKEQLLEFDLEARRLNDLKEGDQAVFYLRKL